MDTQRFVAGPLSVLCILALVMGTASAAVITATGRTSNPDAGHDHHHLSPEAIINTLEQEGVDVTEVRTFLQNGDTDAVRAWLEAHRPTMPDGSPRSPPDLTDSTRQQEIITRLEEEGVDVSDVKASLQNGDTTAVKDWLENYFQAHKREKPDGSARSPPDLTDPAQQQQIITRLEEEGVDVSDVKASLQTGDITAVQAWLETYFQAHKREKPDGSGRSPPDLSDPDQEEKIIDRLEEEGVDVTAVQTSLQNGDTTAVQSWLETYLHSHEGEMAFHRPPAEPPAVGRMGTGE